MITAALLVDSLHLGNDIAGLGIEPPRINPFSAQPFPLTVSDSEPILFRQFLKYPLTSAMLLSVTYPTSVFLYADRHDMIVSAVYVCVLIDYERLIPVPEPGHHVRGKFTSLFICQSF